MCACICYLRSKHGSRRYFHVCPELEVAQKTDGVLHRDVAIHLEENHCDWSTGQDEADEVFR